MTDQLVGRPRKPPSRYTKALADAVIDIRATGRPWVRLAGSDVAGLGMLPAYRTPYVWARTRPEFAERWADARIMAADCRADEAAEIIKQGTPAQQASLLMAQAARLSPENWGVKGAAAPPAAKRLVILVRKFVPVIRPDGRVICREIRPDGSVVDEA